MQNDHETNQAPEARGFLSGLVRLFSEIVRDVAASLFVVVLTFCFATAISASVLWYYQWPLVLSPVGGFIVLGVMLLFWYDH